MTQLPDLDRLVAAIDAMSPADGPLDRLATAVQVREDLDDLADGVLKVFVDRARQADCSWSQIGGVLGVSKQAVQQRHTRSTARRGRLRRVFDRRARPPTFEHLSGDARTAIRYAGTEAARLGCHRAGPEHVLLGLLHASSSAAAEALASVGVSVPEVQRLVVEASDGPTASAQAPRSPHTVPLGTAACEVLERALREAHRLHHDHIGTEHILAGLVQDCEGLAVAVLHRLRANPDQARDAAMLIAR